MYSPLEQFSVISLYSLEIGFIDVSVTNSAIYCLLTIGCIRIIWSTLFLDGGLIIPSRYQVVSEMLYEFVSGLVLEQLGSYEARKYIGIVFTTWLFIFTANLIGLIPFSFATTAQLVVAFGLSFSLFIGVTLIGVFKHGLSFLSFFLPGGAPIGLAPLLVVIELISYIFRPISLGVRLFANITAGHSLLAIIANFAWAMATNGLYAILSIIPIVVIVAIYGLELAVAFLQAYVFAVLLCIYLKDAIELH
uniref:ATP synthase F0 subunit a n=1 Tax=Ulva meridionalis TaxID=434723 RepID=UPI0021141024|nr:ATP synthase F0 subunit a [Ulva meridionalis]UTA96499.1 ATP synthase F0 subunit a [Ulva meridionalis]UTA96559.1 ATP synthase F0 subunit a [Ulva meridionalis]UTA96616.1 ATP synthase F0 subunit a [Ulva meridionalis]UTA96668.1 ATP synthase F0 subunit a [Ulva meridionalis]UTA96721.1 ATP synthase F0 subunit a [Ulva meridionalis]